MIGCISTRCSRYQVLAIMMPSPRQRRRARRAALRAQCFLRRVGVVFLEGISSCTMLAQMGIWRHQDPRTTMDNRQRNTVVRLCSAMWAVLRPSQWLMRHGWQVICGRNANPRQASAAATPRQDWFGLLLNTHSHRILRDKSRHHLGQVITVRVVRQRWLCCRRDLPFHRLWHGRHVKLRGGHRGMQRLAWARIVLKPRGLRLGPGGRRRQRAAQDDRQGDRLRWQVGLPQRLQLRSALQ